VALVEEGADFVTLLEARDARAGGKDRAGCVGAGDNRKGGGKGVFALTS
jgi:hypothetical protein